MKQRWRRFSLILERIDRAEKDHESQLGKRQVDDKARHGDEAFDTDGIINMMMNLEREPDRVKKEITDTVSVIQKIAGKSLRSLERSCSLLKLPEEIQNALREGLIGVSQGYIFAANLDHPLLINIFQRTIGDD